MTSEFEIIQRHFNKKTKHTILGIGDDAAIIKIQKNYELVVSSDMLVENIHFQKKTDPSRLGWKSLAVNLSDIASMGAKAKWVTLSISLPKPDQIWLKKFSQGFFKCAEKFGVDLIGGDTTKGPLVISITIMGEIAKGQSLLRSAAKINDDIWVTGQLGNASMGLASLQGKIKLTPPLKTRCVKALEIPMPKVLLGIHLSKFAHSCIDVSDGLIQDLGHIIKNSKVGATIFLNQIPCEGFIKTSKKYHFALNGGDDYELLFTAPVKNRTHIEKIAKETSTQVNRIGIISNQRSIKIVNENGKLLSFNAKGFDHFA